MPKKTANAVKDLEPEGLAPAGSKWQQLKSSQTRTAILEATIDCLERHGYAQTTMQLIAEVAKISRGAMTHHYTSKQELISAVIDYLFYRRMAIFSERISSLTDKQRVEENLGIERAWEVYLSREHKAYMELSVAARTDVELQALFLPKAQRYEKMWRAEVVRIMPEWRDKPDLLEHGSDFVEAMLQGLAIHRSIIASPEREAVVRALLAEVLRQLRDGKLKVPPKNVIRKFVGPREES